MFIRLLLTLNLKLNFYEENYLIEVVQKAFNYKIYPRSCKPSSEPYYYKKKATTKINVRN